MTHVSLLLTETGRIKGQGYDLVRVVGVAPVGGAIPIYDKAWIFPWIDFFGVWYWEPSPIRPNVYIDTSSVVD